MDYVDSIEMYVFNVDLKNLMIKAQAAGMKFSPKELARRMLILRRARVANTDEIERRVLVDVFTEPDHNTAERTAPFPSYDLVT